MKHAAHRARRQFKRACFPSVASAKLIGLTRDIHELLSENKKHELLGSQMNRRPNAWTTMRSDRPLLVKSPGRGQTDTASRPSRKAGPASIAARRELFCPNPATSKVRRFAITTM